MIDQAQFNRIKDPDIRHFVELLANHLEQALTDIDTLFSPNTGYTRLDFGSNRHGRTRPISYKSLLTLRSPCTTRTGACLGYIPDDCSDSAEVGCEFYRL